ncbi:MAG: sulfatase-like hydrolase/transferase [Draconibacterium sp.]
MLKSIVNISIGIALILGMSSTANAKETKKPNVILIMADDMGYECLGTYGSTSYSTPNLDKLASNGMQFNNCVANPLCSPSRVKIMTGLRNYQNYEKFGYINIKERTFANVAREAGYATCISGKWQLNGVQSKSASPDWNDKTKPNKMGFDEHYLWQFTHGSKEGERYADPLIEANGKELELSKDAYGPDVFSDYVLDFVERKKDQPFFVYYPMVLVHYPFVPTPDSEDWKNPDLRYKQDTAYFKDMVTYCDKMVGRLTNKLKELGIYDNTVIMFCGDNGTMRGIDSRTNHGIVKGGKGTTTDAGTHVPLIVSWPEKIKKGQEFDGLIEFSDFYTTLADLFKKEEPKNDGVSFYPLLTGGKYKGRETAVVHYNPMWAPNVQKFANQFVRTVDYKLYADGKFYNLKKDVLEESPLTTESLTTKEKEVYATLKKEIETLPTWDASIPKTNYLPADLLKRFEENQKTVKKGEK